jgi:hypothetical protein
MAKPPRDCPPDHGRSRIEQGLPERILDRLQVKTLPDVKPGRCFRGGANASTAKQDALRTYHLERMVSKFNTVISPENAEILARLLDIDNDYEEDAI